MSPLDLLPLLRVFFDRCDAQPLGLPENVYRAYEELRASYEAVVTSGQTITIKEPRALASLNPDYKPSPVGYTRAQKQIVEEGDAIIKILLEKNRQYGNSALEPKRIFSKEVSAADGIRVRLDDKLSRIANQQTDDTEDSALDLLGYLILLRIAIKNKV